MAKPVPSRTNCCDYPWSGHPDDNPLRIHKAGAQCSKCGEAYLLREEEAVEVLYNQALQAARNRGYSYLKTMHFVRTDDAKNTREVAVVEMVINNRWGRWEGDTIEEALSRFIGAEDPLLIDDIPVPAPVKKKPSSFL